MCIRDRLCITCYYTFIYSFFSISSIVTFILFITYLVPVSYTHLDVYKRQTKFCSYTFICKEFQQSTRQEIYPWYNAGRQVQCYAFWKNGSNPYYTIYIQVLLVTISVVKKLVKIVMKCSWHQWQMLVCFFLNERESTSKYLLICVIKF